MHCAHSGWTRARLYQCKPRLDQVTASAGLAVIGYGDGGTGAGQMRVRQGAAVLVQGANRGGSTGAHGWPGHGYGGSGGRLLKL